MDEPPSPTGPAGIDAALRAVDYLADTQTVTTLHLAERLDKPVLVEGPAGTGKTELAKAVARIDGSPLIRLQCHEGIDESKALYEWDYRKQLLRLQATADTSDWAAVEQDIFSEPFLLERPLLAAIRSERRVVLLIDEVDRLDVETEALLLEVLSEYQVSVPELGTVRARTHPRVFLTSNSSRELSEALKRRCLYLHLGYPTPEREREIIQARVPGLSTAIATQVADTVGSMRRLELRKRPSVSETLDWARILLDLRVSEVDDDVVAQSLSVLLKNQSDIELVSEKLGTA
ncbi:AAA family ATPase [Actinophytocola oryzae]|uniref:MoxR-like ATPase n=1 Tax=Actinophytocola oryzae TaxID=502181 RepID=A0A4R7VFK6_9PSEU|nr:MoxR family ATPase [Actinophytocola oryzae]TDV48012.1 MoxR-like ATPase [Actinophytocola oryzae]